MTTVNPTPASTSMPSVQISNKLYNVLHPTAQIILPALGTLYFALAQIWGIPKGEEVIGTITAVDVFLGAFLGLSTLSYNASDAKYDGAINVVPNPDKGTTDLNVSMDPNGLESKKHVMLKVNQIPPKTDTPSIPPTS